MAWWLWLVLGLLLLAGEILTPGGFYVFFFGLAALVVGGLVCLGAAGPGWAQWLLFSALSVVLLLVLRGPLLRRIAPRERESLAVDSLVGELAVALEDLPAGAIGKAELRGTAWSARNAGTRPLARGERAEADGQAAAILAVAHATAEGIRKVADAINVAGGYEAVQLRVAEQYIGQFGQLAKESNTMVMPANVADVGSMIALAMNVIAHRPAQAAPAR